MRTNRRRAILLVAGLGLLAACTSSAEEAVDSTTTTEVVTTTTEAPVTTQTTLSEFEIEQAALAEAEAEITAAIEGWYTYPVDTSLGEAGLPLEFITGAVEQRLIDLAQARIAAGEIQRSRGGDTIEIFEIRVDLEAGIADLDVCTLGDHVLVDAESGEELAADDGDSWEGQAQARLVDGVWLIEDFFSDQENGGNQCVLSE